MALINVWPVSDWLMCPSWMALKTSMWLKKKKKKEEEYGQNCLCAAAQHFTPKCSEKNCRSVTILDKLPNAQN